ncbi:GGDEF domain-containing protein [Emcibacter nanhaiensis]|uniref:diguanylate cyclase n=1 Tax=Emcibacter nanhaiensis TaxID=1505037 RepID=A0A501PC52_9PROT|nr:GGDEF domain-containing protein [Emcibacter nanhaiensis]TPD57768.1 GGDEF domain-containing protein [Emcibacter nanhaiensis]
MKVGKTGSVGKSGPVRRKPAVKSGKVEATSSVRSISDTSSVLGIPPEEMTERVQRAIMTLMSEVESMRRELELAHRKISELERLADQDSLINISNRRAFVREMTRMIAYSERYGINSSLIYLDLNDLKVINDSHGHAAGDAALVYLAETMVTCLRDSDIIGRLGGDEFGIILPKASEQDAIKKASFIVDKVNESPLIWDGQEIALNVAFGVYSLKSGESPDQALDEADKKMYAHKQDLKKEKA